MVNEKNPEESWEIAINLWRMDIRVDEVICKFLKGTSVTLIKSVDLVCIPIGSGFTAFPFKWKLFWIWMLFLFDCLFVCYSFEELFWINVRRSSTFQKSNNGKQKLNWTCYGYANEMNRSVTSRWWRHQISVIISGRTLSSFAYFKMESKKTERGGTLRILIMEINHRVNDGNGRWLNSSHNSYINHFNNRFKSIKIFVYLCQAFTPEFIQATMELYDLFHVVWSHLDNR